VIAVTVALPILLFVIAVIAMPILMCYQSGNRMNSDTDIYSVTAVSQNISTVAVVPTERRRLNTSASTQPVRPVETNSDLKISSSISALSSNQKKKVSFQTHMIESESSPQRVMHRRQERQQPVPHLPTIRMGWATPSSTTQTRAPCSDRISSNSFSSRHNNVASTIDLRYQDKMRQQHDFEYLYIICLYVV
jgi:hypothetical protein